MSKSIKTTASDILNTQLNHEETHKESSDLITHKQLEGTPFVITGDKENGYFLRLGNYRLTENQETEKGAENKLYEDHWIIMVNVICAIIHLNKKNPDILGL